MASSKTYQNVSAATWACVKSTSTRENGTVYNPPDGDQGTASTSTIVGEVVLGWVLNPSAQTVTYTIQKKPALAPESSIWSGIANTIDGCNA